MRGSEVLMVKRARDPFKGTWMFPSGFVDFGEHACDALVREVREETGLAVLRATLLGVFQSEDDPRELGHHVFFFLAEADGGEVVTDSEENADISWFDTSAPPAVAWKLHQRFVAVLKSGQLHRYTTESLNYEFGG
jgi:8-oxo-dGTP diphosphatase